MSLTQQQLKDRFLYDPDTGLFTYTSKAAVCVDVGQVAGCVEPNDGYIFITVNYKTYRAHRLAFMYMLGRWPIQQVDHINGVRTDNRWANLREATPKQNNQNQRPGKANKSGVVGVYKDRDKWRAIIYVDGRSIHLGTHASIEGAVAARRAAEDRYFTHHVRAE